ncbi:Atlastin [Gryllus bimaculatus]|nr:Atlastin [Gryllus bimaculatus]
MKRPRPRACGPPKRVDVVRCASSAGTFDSHSTMKDCSTVFALSTMVSSVLPYARPPATRRQIRDWPYPYECAFGYEGGEQVLRKRLLATDSKHPQLVHVRQGLQRTFQRIRCFLMPHPGMAVTTSAQYDGRHSLMEEDFKQHLLDFTESVLAPENLVVKKIGGSVVKCRDLFDPARALPANAARAVALPQAYARVYQGRELPEPKTLYLATAEANNLAASAAGRASYAREMDAALAAASPQRPLTSDGLRRRHSAARAAGLRAFDARRKLGGPDFCAEYRARLAAELDAQLQALRGLFVPGNDRLKAVDAARRG